jgi:hypothetical protein
MRKRSPQRLFSPRVPARRLSRSPKKIWRSAFPLLVLLLAISVMASSEGSLFRVTSASQPQRQLSAEALQQIRALLAEKESRTPAQQKIDSQLIYEMKSRRGDRLLSAVPAMETGVVIDGNGKTEVDITARIEGSLLEDLDASGAEVSSVFPQYNALRARVALDQLEAIAGLPQVIFIMPKQEANVWHADNSNPVPTNPLFTELAPDLADRAARVRARLAEALRAQGKGNIVPDVGSKQSEGDTTHKANTARTTFGANGAGVRIGVISNGVVSLAASQALGDLGPVTVLPGQTGTGDEGTAMLEIVHDLAPGADLYFATANPTIAAFAQNVRDLRSVGCDIIIDDVFYFVETPFQDGQTGVTSNTNGGLVIQAVNDVTAAGAMYFSSAGNQGNQNDATSSCYQGDFANGGTIGIVPGGNVHDFGGGAQFDLITTGSGSVIDLYWADPLGGSANDYDLFVLNSTGVAVVASSTNVQSGTQDPFEQVNSGNTTNNRVVVLQKTGAANRFFHVTINANGVGKLGTSTEGTTKGHSISSLAYSVGATPAQAPGPFPAAHSSSNVTETFSADGPRRIFFNANSTAITPGNFSSTGGTLRQKPDITAADKVSVTGVGGFPTTFSGTSAAAPHAGAIAGLLRSQFPNLTPAQVRTILTSTAIDIEAAGVDRDSGVGIVMPFEAEQSNGAVASANFEKGTVTATEVCCNGNTFIEPGESGSLSVQLTNTGVATATGVSATLTTTTPNVTITQPTSAYPNMAAAASGTNSTLYRFVLSASAPCDLLINFTLTVNYTGGNSPRVTKLSVRTGRPPVSVATTLDTTAPPVSSDYTAATGTETLRLFRDGVASTCGLVKSACPGTFGAGTPRFDSYSFATCATGAGTRCITVTLTPACSTLEAVAYLGSFNSANVCTNYLADAGISPGTNTPTSFTFNVPAGSAFVVIVNEITAGGSTGCNYTLNVSGLCASVCPTAANGNIGGTITDANGAPVGGVTINLSGTESREAITDSNGRYSFDNVETNGFYTITPSRVNYSFSPQDRTFSLLGGHTDASFTASANSASSLNPLDSADYFVRQQYVDFLGREPDESGFAFWSREINSCGSDQGCVERKRINVSAAFFLSIEFQQTGFEVYRMYKAAYGNLPGAPVPVRFGELMTDTPSIAQGVIVNQAGWQQTLDSNTQGFAADFVRRARFTSLYPTTLTPEQFVDKLFANAGVSPSNSERSAAISEFGSASDTSDARARGRALRRVAENSMLARQELNQAFVLMQYLGYLRRDPNSGPDTDFSGYTFWLNKLNTFGNFQDAEMVKAFLVSGEYRGRFLR